MTKLQKLPENGPRTREKRKKFCKNGRKPEKKKRKRGPRENYPPFYGESPE